jgi:hypothetical protein
MPEDFDCMVKNTSFFHLDSPVYVDMSSEYLGVYSSVFPFVYICLLGK